MVKISIKTSSEESETKAQSFATERTIMDEYPSLPVDPVTTAADKEEEPVSLSDIQLEESS